MKFGFKFLLIGLFSLTDKNSDCRFALFLRLKVIFAGGVNFELCLKCLICCYLLLWFFSCYLYLLLFFLCWLYRVYVGRDMVTFSCDENMMGEKQHFLRFTD